MKENTHPDYYQAKVRCGGCGSTFVVGSTVAEMTVNVCSSCHPFYTGKQKYLDTEGRIDKFRAKYAKFQGKAEQN